jgi:hypothetical protein
MTRDPSTVATVLFDLHGRPTLATSYSDIRVDPSVLYIEQPVPVNPAR